MNATSIGQFQRLGDSWFETLVVRIQVVAVVLGQLVDRGGGAGVGGGWPRWWRTSVTMSWPPATRWIHDPQAGRSPAPFSMLGRWARRWRRCRSMMRSCAVALGGLGVQLAGLGQPLIGFEDLVERCGGVAAAADGWIEPQADDARRSGSELAEQPVRHRARPRELGRGRRLVAIGPHGLYCS